MKKRQRKDHGMPLVRTTAGSRFSAPVAAVLKAALVWPLPLVMWNGEMKKNGAYERRDARPYARV